MNKEKESPHIIIGNTGFNKESVRKMSFKKFEEQNKHLLYLGMSLEDAYVKCGGKIK